MHPAPRLQALAHALALASAALLGSNSLTAQAQTAPGFYRQPSVQGQQLIFVAEGDLWRVGLAGGRAERLTTHGGQETQPAVSPDGRWLAFTGQYDGPGDVYLMPVQGGVPKRLSWEGAAVKVWGFSPRGEVLYTGPTQSGQPVTQLFAVDPQTLKRRALPVAQATDGALSADGLTLYFTRNGLRGDNARQYRGGAIARLWAMDLRGNAEAKPLLAEGANDRRPMPYKSSGGQERIAFLSDRDGTVNLWSVDAQGQDLRQHSKLKGWDIRHASVNEGRAVFSAGADLYSLDLNAATTSTTTQPLTIQLSGDFEQQRERWIKKPQDFLTHTTLAPNGERVLLASRGHLATQGLGAMRRAELPQAADGRCRSGEFSADSSRVFAICDFSGEREVWRFAANGLGHAEQITQGATAQRMAVLPSPDGRWLAHTDKEGRLFLSDLKAEGKPSIRQIAQDAVGGEIKHLSWSPDGQALAFTQALRNSIRSQLMLFNLKDGSSHALSSDRYDSEAPSFTPDGRWLYFASRRSFAVSNPSGPWGDRNMGPFFDRSTRIYALALQAGQRFPFAAKDELSPEDGKPEAKADAKPDTKADTKTKPAIQWTGLRERLFEVPLAAGNYSELRNDGKRLWFLDSEGGAERKTSLKTLAIANEGASAETVSGDIKSYELSADGKKLLLVRAAKPDAAAEILLVEAAAKLPAELAKFQIRWSDWQIATEPKQEWRGMFADAWRMHRDYFYDKAMHGVDWAAMRAKYEPLLARVTDRAELAELMAQMVSELGALHSQVNAGELRSGPEVPGLAGLGARLAPSARGLAVEQIYRSDPELPGEQGPLADPALGLKVGDVITAINGRSAQGVAHAAELLRGQAGRQVLLQVLADGKADGKEVQRVVTPVDGKRETQLRYNDWRFSRAQAVAAASGGRIGYLHLRAMGRDDIADFAREFYAQSDRDGLIIDVRFNGGGNIDSWILEKLLRRAWAFWQRRSPEASPTFSNMQETFRGHLAVLINEETYSDGETFSEGIKRLGLGPTIGKTTSGAGVWLSDQNRLMDNGIMRAAETGQMAPDGRFIVEGKGVSPDVEVDNPPRATFEGGDAQLDKAIALLTKAMADKPRTIVKPGAYPRPVKIERE